MQKYSLLILSLIFSTTALHANEARLYQYHQKNYVVFSAVDHQNLVLALNDQRKALRSFSTWQKSLSDCQSLKFAMNAGMYHANYQPVGLYIEKGKTLTPINTDQGQGNFFMQPNGILAWNQQQAKIIKTADWQKEQFDANYATQSGPMLVIDGELMPKFMSDSKSKHIRNGIGIKQGKLYFVISQQRVNFYEFAKFFKDELGVEHALYLDGSVSSIYLPSLSLNIQRATLGPMLGVIQHRSNC